MLSVPHSRGIELASLPDGVRLGFADAVSHSLLGIAVWKFKRPFPQDLDNRLAPGTMTLWHERSLLLDSLADTIRPSGSSRIASPFALRSCNERSETVVEDSCKESSFFVVLSVVLSFEWFGIALELILQSHCEEYTFWWSVHSWCLSRASSTVLGVLFYIALFLDVPRELFDKMNDIVPQDKEVVVWASNKVAIFLRQIIS